MFGVHPQTFCSPGTYEEGRGTGWDGRVVGWSWLFPTQLASGQMLILPDRSDYIYGADSAPIPKNNSL